MLTAGQLAWMRQMQQRILPDTCTIQRAARTVDGIGQPVLTWANLATGVACRLSQRRAVEEVQGERVLRVTGWVLTLPDDEDVTAADRVVVGSRTFEVTGVTTDQSWLTALRVELVEVV